MGHQKKKAPKTKMGESGRWLISPESKRALEKMARKYHAEIRLAKKH